MAQTIMFEGLILSNVHEWWDCQNMDEHEARPAPCVIHRPTHHHMRLWPLHWRNDRGIFERICDHGTGHPDPDQFPYWQAIGQEAQAVHGCDGCCSQGPLMTRGGKHVA